MFDSTSFRWRPIEVRKKPPEGLGWALTYQDPDGEEMIPRPRDLRAILYEKGPEYYWNSGSASLYGTARDNRGVVVYSIHNTPSLSWFLEEPYGFHFTFHPANGPRLLTYDGSGPQPRVKHYLGGEPMFLPVGCFVSRDVAWEVVQDFLHRQQPSPVVKWISAGEFEVLGIDYNRPD